MKFFYTILFLLLGSLWLFGQSPSHTLFLLGDAGAPVLNGQDKTLQLLQKQLDATPNSTLVVLGDNIYQHGMPDAEYPERGQAEARILEQLKILTSYQGKAYIIPGNHDWKQGRLNGWRHVRNQEKFVEEYLNRGNVFLPDGGCPDPTEIQLTNQITLVVIDTQWWLHPSEDRPEEESDCDCKSESDVVLRLHDIMTRNKNRQVIVAGHHPMYTYGEHNGAATWKDHIFPFTHAKKNWYIPLPIIGSIMPLYRGLFGDVQDTKNPRNRFMRKSILATLEPYPNTIYANGHDHSLQYIQRDSLHFITSGAGSKQSVVRKRKYSLFADSQKGFARLDFYPNGRVTLEFWETIQPETPAYQHTLVSAGGRSRTDSLTTEKEDRLILPAQQRVTASLQYQARPVKKLFLGENYRSIWQQPIDVPVFDIAREGLKITQKGGGQQTKSLRLEDTTGKEYVLRSIEKDPEKAIPEVLRQTVIADLVQDQISAAHPYGALAIPALAEAAGVPHAQPKLVYIPDDPRLGEYRKLFAHTLAIFEERNPEAVKGDGRKSYSTTKMLEKLEDDNDNQVNQQAVVRARLFDMLIGDWDRHDDQWRWEGEKTEKGLLFSPIPRDRDQAFFVNEGWIPRLVSRDWAMPKIQGFGYRIRDVRTFNFNARYFDRSFLNGLSLRNWQQMAQELQSRLTDTIITQSVHQLPDSVFALRGNEIIEKLKSRRSFLLQEAEKYYHFLAEKVDVVGSDKNEFFWIEQISKQQARIRMYKTNKDNDTTKVLYDRLFDATDTREVRLYGLGGKDSFLITGNTHSRIRIRIIGGGGKDSIADSVKVRKNQTPIYVYDLQKTTTLPEATIHNRTQDDPKVNVYDRKAFKYNLVMPLVSLQFNPDDGLFLGGGVLIRRQGFRKEPYAMQHRITANHAAATNAFNFDYQGSFVNVFRNTDLQVNADIKAPNFVNNFFGLGNESVYSQEQEINYYRVRFENVSLNALLVKRIGSKMRLFAGPQLETVEVEESSRRFINEYASQNQLPESFFQRKSYAGLYAALRVDTRDSRVFPTTGLVWNTELKFMRALSNDITRPYSQIHSDVSFYWTAKLPARITFATRFGGGLNLNSFEFFQANTLGGLSNLRGYRRTRFSGEDSFYNNTEVRLRLFRFRTYLFPAFGGIVGFHDVGRVWLDNEKSNVWHTGYGAGVFLVPYQQLVVTAMYGFSKEDSLPIIKLGFFF